MGFAAGIEAGRRSAIDDPKMLIDPSQALSAMRPRYMQGHNTLKGSPLPGEPGYPNAEAAAASAFGSSGGSRPGAGAIHSQAAQAVLEEKKLDLEQRKVAIEEAKLAEQQATGAIARSQAIDAGYQKEVEGIRGTEKYDKEKDLMRRKDSMPQLMQGIYGKNPAIVKDWINQYGNPQAKIQDVQFATPEIDPKNPDGVMVTYENGSTSFFKDTKDFYKGFIAWMDPKVEESLREGEIKERETKVKESEAETKRITALNKTGMSDKEYADAYSKAVKAYNDTYKVDSISGKRAADAPDQQTYVDAYMDRVASTKKRTSAISEEGAPQAKQPKPETGPGMKGYQEFKSRDGRVKRVYPDGREVVFDKNGKKLGERVTGKIPKKLPDVPTPGETATKDTKNTAEKRVEGTTTRTDPKTGDTIKTVVYSDGTTKETREKKKK